MKQHLHAGMRLLLWEVTSKSKIWYSNVTMFIKQDIGGLWKKKSIFLPYLFFMLRLAAALWHFPANSEPTIPNKVSLWSHVRPRFPAKYLPHYSEKQRLRALSWNTPHKREYTWRKLHSSAKIGSKYRGIRIKAPLLVKLRFIIYFYHS